MNGNSFGTLFRITTFGESHGEALGVIIDGCPAGLTLDLDSVKRELDRRKPGQSKLVSPRKEGDEFELLSGLFEGITTGQPLCFIIRNEDTRSKDYTAIKDLFRPGHADFSYFAKWGHRDYRGGGRSSVRESVGRVIGGAVAKQLLASIGVTVRAGVVQVGKVKAERFDWTQVEANDVRSVDPDKVTLMIQEIEFARRERDSIGGVVQVEAHGVPTGLGEPVFNKLDGVLAGALMGINAVKGVEIGSGFESATKRGTEMCDAFYPEGFKTNNHGGILGGITTGAPIVLRAAFKPTSSLPQEQNTIDKNFKATTVATLGRHDPCVVMRAVPIVEAMVALVLCDYWMLQGAELKSREGFSPHKSPAYGMKS